MATGKSPDIIDISLQSVLTSQENLKDLCADRPLVTDEIFPPNAFYGVGSVLKHYAGLPQNYPLKAVIPHGVCFSHDYLWEVERDASVPMVLCFPEFRTGLYARKTHLRAVPSAAPFLYVSKLLEKQPRPERSGTIFFPAHSTHHVTAVTDYDALSGKLSKLRGEFQPVTVCLYWREFERGLAAPFLDRGFRVVSAGHLYDPLFLIRFHHLCSLHRFAASNELGSCLFYSVKSGCSFFFLKAAPVTYAAPTDYLERDFADSTRDQDALFMSLFGQPQQQSTPEQLEIVDSYLGTRFLRTPGSLRRLLRAASAMDRFGYWTQGSGMMPRFRMPTRLRREGLLPGTRRRFRQFLGRE